MDQKDILRDKCDEENRSDDQFVKEKRSDEPERKSFIIFFFSSILSLRVSGMLFSYFFTS